MPKLESVDLPSELVKRVAHDGVSLYEFPPSQLVPFGVALPAHGTEVEREIRASGTDGLDVRWIGGSSFAHAAREGFHYFSEELVLVSVRFRYHQNALCMRATLLDFGEAIGVSSDMG